MCHLQNNFIIEHSSQRILWHKGLGSRQLYMVCGKHTTPIEHCCSFLSVTASGAHPLLLVCLWPYGCGHGHVCDINVCMQ